MVAFSRITFVLAVAGLSSAQSFSESVHPGFPTEFPSGAARPTGGFGGHGHGGHHSGFPHPTGGFHSGEPPKPSGTGVFGAQAVQSGKVPYPTGGAFPSGAAKPSGHHGHHGHHGKGGKGSMHSGRPSGAVPTASPTAASGLERRHSGGFPAPSGGFPSGGFPEGGAPFPTGAGFSAFPSGVAHPSGHHGHHGKGGKGGKHSSHLGGAAPTGFVTSTIRGA